MKLRRLMVAMGVSAVLVCMPLLGGNAATISPVAGSTAVNGRAISAGSALLPGERVTISPNGTARVVVAGSEVLVAAKTVFSLQDNGTTSRLLLDFGGLNVTGSEAVAVSNHLIVPQAKSKFDVLATSHVNYLTVHAGTVSLQAFGRSETVRAGESVSFDNGQAAAAAAAAGGSGGISIPLGVGIAAAASALTGIVVHEATVCSTCTVVTSTVVP